ncbi:uncharacterized protein LOC127247532 [Andrographis paniculata]|uniref:uncharacterized protein LOC127247532 n=1 Tax=Andrographis paniculata TaxID=175694 RepID=UPI0021E81D94|nr:uncharacterized protein LOC127247532 [Andrographis paniculata]
MTSPNPRKRCAVIVCLTVTAVIVLLVLLIVILGFTVYKPKHPVTTVNSVSVADLDLSLDLTSGVKLNISLDAGINVRNPNRVGFKYSDSTAYLRYRGKDVGEAPIAAGRVGARSSTDMNITLTVIADRLVSDRNFFSDAASGTLPFESFIKLDGKVRILFSFHVTAYATCDLQIHVFNRSVSQKCHYKTKL